MCFRRQQEAFSSSSEKSQCGWGSCFFAIMHIQVGTVVQVLVDVRILLTMNKRKLEPNFDHVPEHLHFREDMADLMLSNEISFRRGRRVCANAVNSL